VPIPDLRPPQATPVGYKADVQPPFLLLITNFAPALKEIGGGCIDDPSPNGGSMLRIYRDIRLSKDRSPYKTCAAAHFRHAKGKDGPFLNSADRSLSPGTVSAFAELDASHSSFTL